MFDKSNYFNFCKKNVKNIPLSLTSLITLDLV